MGEAKDDEELLLEAQVFGALGADSSQKLDSLARDITERNSSTYRSEEPSTDSDSLLFVIDKKKMPSFRETAGVTTKVDNNENQTGVWHDEDDEEVVVNIQAQKRLKKLRKSLDEDDLDGSDLTNRLRSKHIEMNKSRTKWADKIRNQIKKGERKNNLKRPRDGESSDSESDLFRSSEAFVKPSRRSFGGALRLASGRLEVSRLTDANRHGKSNSVVQSIDWHRNAMLFLTAGLDKTLRLFQVDGKENSKVHSAHFADMPIHEARFAGETDNEIICVGRRKFMYWVDLETNHVGRIPYLVGRDEKSLETMTVSPDGTRIGIGGNDGNVLLMSQKTKQLTGSLKMNGTCRCLAFSNDSNKLYSSGGSGYVYIWDLRMNRCLHRHSDEGSTGTRTIALSSDNARYATGSDAGVVNIYDAESTLGKKHPSPIKSVLNLTTPIDEVSFNHDGQLLAMISRRKKDSMKLVNCNTLNVVPNWPTSGTPLRYTQCAAFSPNSGMLAIGNDSGKCLLYRILHYEAA